MAAPHRNPLDPKSAGERVAKVIARSGLCSRREAEALIGAKRVSVNGAIIESAALDILPADTVLVDGKPLSLREPPRLWRYHKPKGRVTTHKDPEGRPTVFEALPEGLPRLISVGRLDFNTEGLLLLTNDGDLARHLELPATGWTRRYRVRAFGEVSETQLRDLAGGLTVSGMTYGPIEASLEREQGGNVWISVSIREGKNREVRRIMEHLGLTVNRLIRVSFGPFMLGDLETGQIEEVKTAVLKDQLGPRLSRQLGVKREPLREERRLPQMRQKASYLRRAPATQAREEQRRTPEPRPLKRRRILEEGGTAKVEFVAEKKPARARFGEDAGSGRKPRFGSQRPDREGASFRQKSEDGGGRDFHRARGGGKGPDAKAKPQRHRPHSYGERDRVRGDSPENASATPLTRPASRPASPYGRGELRHKSRRPAFEADANAHRKPRDRKPFAGSRDARGEDAQRVRTPHRGGPGERQRPPRRWETAGGDAAGSRKPRPDFERQGERPRSQRVAGRAEENSGFREGQRERPERRAEGRDASFRRPDAGERKPFKPRRHRGDRFTKPGEARSQKQAAGKAPDGRQHRPPRKPGQRPRPETDKERP
jgi:23S rRNA pseudouridine2605 synthase